MKTVTRKICIVLAGVGLIASSSAWLGLQLGRPIYYSDGTRAMNAHELRHAGMLRWGAPEPEFVLPGPVRGRVTELPDGRLLYGRNINNNETDLVVFDPRRPNEPPEVVLALDSAGHNMSPCATPDGDVLFASDRPGGAGGFDIYRCRYRDGQFFGTQPLGENVNTGFDESDPAMSPLADRLAFVRRDPGLMEGRNATLWLATLGGETDLPPPARALFEQKTGRLAAMPLDRDPAFSADGKALYFVRQQGLLPPRLMFTFDHQQSFVKPLPVDMAEGEVALRGPTILDDGFALRMLEPGRRPVEGQDGNAEAMTYRSRAREVRPYWAGQAWLEYLLLSLIAFFAILLLLLALGARWHQLDLITKLFLISFALHLLLLLWLSRMQIVRSFMPDVPQPGQATVTLLAAHTGDESSGSGEMTPRQFDVAREASYQPQEASLAAAAPGANDAARAQRQTRAPAAAEARATVTPTLTSQARELSEPSAEIRKRTGQSQRTEVDAARMAQAQRQRALVQANAREATTRQIQVQLPGSEVAKTDTGSRARRPAPAANDVAATQVPTPRLANPSRRNLADAPKLAAPSRSAAAPARKVAAVATPTPSAPALSNAEKPAGRTAPNTTGNTLTAAPTGSELARSRQPRQTQQPEAKTGRLPTAGLPKPTQQHLADAPRSFAPSRKAATPAQKVAAMRTPTPPAPAVSSVDAPAGRTAPEATGNALAATPTGSALDRSRQVRQPQPGEALNKLPTPRSATSASQSQAVALNDSVQTGKAKAVARAGEARTKSTTMSPLVHAELKADRANRDGQNQVSELGQVMPRQEMQPDPRRRRALPKIQEASTAPTQRAMDALAQLDDKLAPASAVAPRSAAKPAAAAAITTAELPDVASLPAVVPMPTRAPSRRAQQLVGSLRIPGSFMERAVRRRQPVAPSEALAVLDKNLFRNRFGQNRQAALKKFGGSKETERAVRRGLEYLARIQRGDGSWGSRKRDSKYGRVKVGKTGLCLLAFLGAGHTPQSKTQHSAVTRRAVEYLLDVQNEDTGHFGDTSTYSHGIATYALAECYAMTKDPKLLAPLEFAVTWIMVNQNRGRDKRSRGGWGYFSSTIRPEDKYARASTTAWQVMALKSARLGGIKVEESYLTMAKEFLWNCYDRRHRYFLYTHKPSRLRLRWRTLPASTPASVFCLQLLGEDASHWKLKNGLKFTVDRTPRGYRRYSTDDFVLKAAGNVYFWYYATLACFLAGGEEWETWNRALKRTLLRNQSRDGSFAPIDTYADYAGDTNRDRAYTTAMCVLSLEVYYRYFTPLLKKR